MLSAISRDTFTVGCVKSYMKQLEQVYLQERQKKRVILQNMPSKVSLTTDLWSDKKMRHFAVITAHWIDEHWDLNSTILDFIPMKGGQKSEDITRYLWKTIEDYSLQQKILAITTDNGQNMIRATQNLLPENLSAAENNKYMGARCCAHIVNIICQEVLKVSQGPISKIRQASKKVLSSGQQIEGLKSLCQNNGETYVSLTTDCYTRWNSSYRMIESAYQMRRSLDMLCGGVLSENEWQCLKKEVDFLKPFKDVVECFESEKKPATPAIIPKFQELEESIRSRSDNLGRAMLTKLEKYWPSEYLEEYQLHSFLIRHAADTSFQKRSAIQVSIA